MKRIFLHAALASTLLCGAAISQVPQLINYQGRVAVGGVNFDGQGKFKFALVAGAGTTSYWSNDGTSTAGSEPSGSVTLAVTKGLYSVLLGDTQVAGMASIPATIFTHSDVRLRVWFNDGTNGFQLLSPDQRIAAVGYAITAGSAATAGYADTAGSANTAGNVPKIGAFSDVTVNAWHTASSDGLLIVTCPVANNGGTVQVEIRLPNGNDRVFEQQLNAVSPSGAVALTVPIATGVSYVITGGTRNTLPVGTWFPLTP